MSAASTWQTKGQHSHYRDLSEIIKMNTSMVKANEEQVHGVLRRCAITYKGDQLQMVTERLRLAEGLGPQKTGGPQTW